MAAILYSANLHSAILVFFSNSLTLAKIASHYMLKNFTHSFWLNLMMAAILNSSILDSAICTKKLHSCILTQIDDGSHLELCQHGFCHYAQKRSSLIHSDPTWWWQPSWILPSSIQPFCTKMWAHCKCELVGKVQPFAIRSPKLSSSEPG